MRPMETPTPQQRSVHPTAKKVAEKPAQKQAQKHAQKQSKKRVKARSQIAFQPEFNDRHIEKVAAFRLGKANRIVQMAIWQVLSENWIRLRKHVSFRSRENRGAVEAYCAMTIRDFEGINARQRWANWRSLPRNLSGNLTAEPWMAIDLCCGVGHSTEVLAHYLAPGSRILGLEFNPEFVELARTRNYPDSTNREAKVAFRAQSILETFADEHGKPIAPRSVDLVNCCGAIGSHFDASATQRVADEINRVLKVGGLATLDAGPDGTSEQDLIRIFEARGFETVRISKSHVLDRFTQVCFRKLRPQQAGARRN